MQTFLTHPSYAITFRQLDKKRLGNQRLETSILLESITVGNGWSKHPASKMWVGYERALRQYLRHNILAWIEQGGKNTMSIPEPDVGYPRPRWWRDSRLYISHRANLLRKDSEFYAQFEWDVDPAMPYHWPSRIPNLVYDDLTRIGFVK